MECSSNHSGPFAEENIVVGVAHDDVLLFPFFEDQSRTIRRHATSTKNTGQTFTTSLSHCGNVSLQHWFRRLPRWCPFVPDPDWEFASHIADSSTTANPTHVQGWLYDRLLDREAVLDGRPLKLLSGLKANDVDITSDIHQQRKLVLDNRTSIGCQCQGQPLVLVRMYAWYCRDCCDNLIIPPTLF